MIRPWMLAAAALAVTACSPREAEKQPAPSERQTTTAPAAAPPTAATPASSAGATVGGDGSEIRLSNLGEADLEANPLAGELACGFTADGATLLIAKGVVASKDPAFGLVKVGDYVERVGAPGGFDGMLKGAKFSGAGKTVIIAVTGPAKGGGESPPSPATLTYQRADGAERVYPGTWTCGP